MDTNKCTGGEGGDDGNESQHQLLAAGTVLVDGVLGVRCFVDSFRSTLVALAGGVKTLSLCKRGERVTSGGRTG